MAKTKFPAKLYVRRMNEGTKDEYLQCAEDFGDLVEAGENAEAAVYELREVGKLSASPAFEKLRLVK